MVRRRLPDLDRGPSGKSGSYEPEAPIPRPPSDKPRLSASDTASCRYELDRFRGTIKYCPKEPTKGKYCDEHQPEKVGKKQK